MSELRSHARRSADPSNSVSLRQWNRARVLTHIIRERETTRAAIARTTRLSPASAANIVGELVEEGLVEERGSRPSSGGRPTGIVGARPDGALAVGIDVGEWGVAAELFDLSMTRVDREFGGGEQPATASAIATEIRAVVAALRMRHEDQWDRVVGIGLGLPGVVETSSEGTQTLYAQSMGWPPVAVSDLCPVNDLPVLAENGAKLQASAELWFGNARGAEHTLVALLGRGVGLGVIANGRITGGSDSSAAEWGHTVIGLGGPQCRCGNRGCLEAYIGADAILDAWRRRDAHFEGRGWNALNALIEARAARDTAATEVIDQVLAALGAGLGSLVNLMNPTRILVGGWVGQRLIEEYPREIQDEMTRHCLARFAAQVELAPTRFGGDAVAIGAGVLSLDALVIRAKAPR